MFVQPVKVFFFDAVGTLFGVKGGVGEQYQAIARKFDVSVESEPIDRAFIEVFRNAPPMAFSGCPTAQIPQQEYQWWREIGELTFRRSGDWEKFTDFELFFQTLYQYFATATPWELYPDTILALEQLRLQNMTMGIISNFDSRLFSVLDALNLANYFDTVTISSQVGAAKPDRQIFQSALDLHQISPNEALHIGDSHREDYEGAIGAGMMAHLLTDQTSLLEVIKTKI